MIYHVKQTLLKHGLYSFVLALPVGKVVNNQKKHTLYKTSLNVGSNFMKTKTSRIRKRDHTFVTFIPKRA